MKFRSSMIRSLLGIKRSILAVVMVFALPLPLVAQEHLDRYERGFRAMRYELFNEAAWWFDYAREVRVTPGGRPARPYKGRNYIAYWPCYYSGVALFNAGQFSDAKERWVECRRYWRNSAEVLGSKADRYENMVSRYLDFTALRNSLIDDIDRVYREGVVHSNGELMQIATETFDSLRSVEMKAAKINGRSDRSNRLEALAGELRDLRGDIEKVREADIDAAGNNAAFRNQSTFLLSNLTAKGLGPVPRCARQYSAASALKDGNNITTGDYEGHYAILISPMLYENQGLRPIPSVSESFERLRASLTRRISDGKVWFDEVVVLPLNIAGGLTKRQFERWLSKRTLERWLGPYKNNLVFIVFAGHACNIDGIGLAPLSDSPSCEEARENRVKFEEMVERSIWVKDIMNLLTPEPRNQGDVVMVFDSCHANLFRDKESCIPWGGGGPIVDAARSRAAIFVAAGREGDYVDQLALVSALADALDGCGIEKNGRKIVTGYDLFQSVENQLRNRNQYLQKYRCVANADYHLGDFQILLTDRCQHRAGRTM